MSTPLLPQAFWFRLAIPCPRIDEIPHAKGRLLNLPDSCDLPDIAMLDGEASWAKLRVAWNPKGLAIAVEVTGKPGDFASEREPGQIIDGVQIWLDTRDTRNVHRATRFCHRFVAELVAKGSGTGLDVRLVQKPIHRAVADAPLCKPGELMAKADRTRKGWRLELFLPASVLHGFDPETNRRLGFAYQVTDPDREDQFLGIGREFPIGEDPSLWSTLELRDAG